MSKPRRKFSREFKLRAIELSYERTSVTLLAKELDVRPELIYRWRSELKADKSGSFPGEGNESLSPEAQENRQLKKALKDKELELEILKKAIGIFSKRDGISTNL
jgi:transposase